MMLAVPKLSFVELDRLLIHEQHDEQRALPLVRRIRESGVFRHPPIVTPLHDEEKRYMVLDGANRVTALRMLGFPHLIAQVVEPEDPGLTLHNWNHVVWEMDGARFMKGFRAIRALRLVREREPDAEASLFGDCRLALVIDCRGRLFSVCTNERTLEKRTDLLNQIVDSYCTIARLDRSSGRDFDLAEQIYPSLAGMVIFPTFEIEQLLFLSGNGYMLPTGITRFTVAPRLLNLNYPLKALASSDPIEKKNDDLQKWIQNCIALKRVRYYSEPTYSFDE